MTIYTEEKLKKLRMLPKKVDDSNQRWSPKLGHMQCNLQAQAADGENYIFKIYQRQNMKDSADFSCGIIYEPASGSSITLARYNGCSHEHGDIAYRPHIHRATERAIKEGRKPESEATETDRYMTLEDAFKCLCEDYHIAGIPASSYEQPSLFQND